MCSCLCQHDGEQAGFIVCCLSFGLVFVSCLLLCCAGVVLALFYIGWPTAGLSGTYQFFSCCSRFVPVVVLVGGWTICYFKLVDRRA